MILKGQFFYFVFLLGVFCAWGAEGLWPEGVFGGNIPKGVPLSDVRRPLYARRASTILGMVGLREYLDRYKGVCFVDVRKSLYARASLWDFRKDVLNLMRSGAKLVARDGCIRYQEPSDSVKDLSEEKTVVRAMFDFMREGCGSLFWLKFHLYEHGYKYSPQWHKSLGHNSSEAFFEVIYAALNVGGVCPFNGVCGVESSDLECMQLFWEKNRRVPEQDFMMNLHQACQCDFRPLILLRILQDTGELAVLEQLMEEGRLCSVRNPVKSVKQKTILGVLHTYLNEKFSVEKIINYVDENQVEAYTRKNFFKDMLILVFRGYPLVYDKTGNTLMLLSKQKTQPVAPKGTNLLTMTYECLCTYGQDICVEEMVYYAYALGYRERETIRTLTNRIQAYQKKLQFLRQIDFGEDDGQIVRVRSLWAFFHAGVPLGVLAPEAHSGDLHEVSRLKVFVEGDDYKVFARFCDKKAKDAEQSFLHEMEMTCGGDLPLTASLDSSRDSGVSLSESPIEADFCVLNSTPNDRISIDSSRDSGVSLSESPQVLDAPLDDEMSMDVAFSQVSQAVSGDEGFPEDVTCCVLKSMRFILPEKHSDVVKGVLVK